MRFAIKYDENDEATYLRLGEVLKISFYGRLSEKVINTGESNIAWNNFAYGYNITNTYQAKPEKPNTIIEKTIETVTTGDAMVYAITTLVVSSLVFIRALMKINKASKED